MSEITPSLRRIVADHAVGQLVRKDGLMAQLGSENGEPKLDWVDGVPRLLADRSALETVEAEAAAIIGRGIRHVIWSGMGGSVMTVRVLLGLGVGMRAAPGITIDPLDSTDPAAINAILRLLIEQDVLYSARRDRAALRVALDNVMMIGVSMGMTSEEPITHLQWFLDLLRTAGLPAEEHVLIMTIPGSYLEQFAEEHGVPVKPIQLDGRNGTGGRMSAPTTRVFLLPVALHLAATGVAPGALRGILERAWQWYDLDSALQRPEGHPFVQLAAALADAAEKGACRLLLELPEGWRGLFPWIEQLMEESLGKGGKGVVVFKAVPLNPDAPCFQRTGTLGVEVVAEGAAPATWTSSDGEPRADTAGDEAGAAGGEAGTAGAGPYRDERPDVNARGGGTGTLVLAQPYLGAEDRVAAVAASFLGWQLAMALYGYLNGITFAGQPAVENYKAGARVLRDDPAPLDIALQTNRVVRGESLQLLTPPGTKPSGDAPEIVARALQAACVGAALDYVDVTVHGIRALTPIAPDEAQVRETCCNCLGVPYKLRVAPQDYHSTEQSEMDGPRGVVSLRLIAWEHASVLLGTYTDRFLQAQAVATWRAMNEAGRPCYLLVFSGSQIEMEQAVRRFFRDVVRRLAG